VAEARKRPVLYVISGGGPPAGQLADFVGFAQGEGWDVCVIATPDGAKFLDITELTARAIRCSGAASPSSANGG
jgi:hypothetical protein